MNTYQQVAQFLLGAVSEAEMVRALEGIMTESEVETIARRLEIIRRLKQREPQHSIATELGVGVATVTRGNAMLKKGYFRNV